MKTFHGVGKAAPSDARVLFDGTNLDEWTAVAAAFSCRAFMEERKQLIKF